MSAEFLLKVAEVLEAAAATLDAHEAEKTAALKKEREGAAHNVAAKFAEATGEDLPEDLLNKLASSDDGVLAAVQCLLDKKVENAVESMGHSSDKSASQVPRTKQERAQAAWDNFGNYIVNS